MIFCEQGQIEGTSSKSLVALGYATNCTMNFTADEQDISSKDSGKWHEKIATRLSWDMSTDNLYSECYDKLMAVALNRTQIDLYFCPSVNTEVDNVVEHAASTTVDGTTYKLYHGKGWISSINATANNGDAGNFTCNFTGTGALEQLSSLPGTQNGVQASTQNVGMSESGTATVMLTGYTGALTATVTPAASGVSVSIAANGVMTITSSSSVSKNAFIVEVEDAGTGTSTSVFVGVSE